LELGVLDQSPIPAGGSAADGLRDSIRLARHAEALGYARYWVAEHHGSTAFAGAAPEILMGQLLAATERIRVGSGGVMLMHYSPYKVAETIGMLASLHPGRVELGIGRAPGTDGITAAALAYGSRIGLDYFPAKVADLAAFLRGSPPATEAFASVRLTPRPDPAPDLWVLGSSASSATLAAHFGLPFCFAHFIAPQDTRAAVDHYRASFRPSEHGDRPRVALGVFALCAEDPDHCEDLARCRDLWRLRLEAGGDPGPCPSIDEARAYPFSAHERARIEARREHQLLGAPEAVRTRIESLAEATGAEAVQVISITPAFTDRLRTYELLARAFALGDGDPAAGAPSRSFATR
jgi:luciferase family oxidoreductase group 1